MWRRSDGISAYFLTVHRGSLQIYGVIHESRAYAPDKPTVKERLPVEDFAKMVNIEYQKGFKSSRIRKKEGE